MEIEYDRVYKLPNLKNIEILEVVNLLNNKSMVFFVDNVKSLAQTIPRG